MKFADAYSLYFLWTLIPLAWLLVWGIQRRKQILSRFADPQVFPFILPGFSLKPRWIKAGLVIAGLGLAILSLAGPQAGFRWEKTTQKGVDIMIALDCSRSMLAQDIKPSRLERAKREIIDLTRLMQSDRAGLVAFAGQAVLQCPLTLDYEAFYIFLNVLNPDYLPVGGTDLTAAIETCYKGFDPEADTDKAILIITDGEDTMGAGQDRLTQLAQKMADQGIKIFTIGVGDRSGAPIPDFGGGFKKDDKGNIILSRVNETVLEKISAMTSGRYVRSVAGDMDLEQIYSEDILNTMERKTMNQGKKKVWEHRFQWVLLPCVLLLLLELFLPAKGKPGNSGNGAGNGLLGLAFLIAVIFGGLNLGLFPTPARAGVLTSPVKEGITAYDTGAFEKAKKHFIDAQLENPDELRLYYNIGAAAYGAGDYALAEQNFSQAALSKDPELKHNALYNLANTRYRQGNMDQAVKDYETLLETFPDDSQALENLDFVKKKQEEEKTREEEQKKSDQNKKDQDKKEPGEDQDKDQDKDKSDQEQKAQEDQGQTDQDKPDQDKTDQGRDGNKEQDEKKSAPKETDPKDQENDESMAQGADGKEGDPSETASPGLENRLNRLTDKPGMGLIPMTNTQKTDKDW